MSPKKSNIAKNRRLASFTACSVWPMCWFACIQSAIEYLGCIFDLNVGVKIENVGDCFIVGIYELTTHGSSWKDHKWIYSVDRSIQKEPQKFILIFDTFVLVNVCRLCRHEREEKSAFTIFLEARCTMTEWMFFKLESHSKAAFVVWCCTYK